MKAVHTRRLLRLAAILKRVREEQFNMTILGMRHREARNHCGTEACALGWAGLDPGFRRSGLVGSWDKIGDAAWLNVRCGPVEGVTAGAAFFGLTGGEAFRLFNGHTRRRRETVIALIRKLAKTREELRS